MSNAIIIHGAYGAPQENWFPWMRSQLEQIGYTVYVPLEKGQQLADKLGVDVTLIKNAGHFNARAGYMEFPDLLTFIREKQ